MKSLIYQVNEFEQLIHSGEQHDDICIFSRMWQCQNFGRRAWEREEGREGSGKGKKVREGGFLNYCKKILSPHTKITGRRKDRNGLGEAEAFSEVGINWT